MKYSVKIIFLALSIVLTSCGGGSGSSATTPSAGSSSVNTTSSSGGATAGTGSTPVNLTQIPLGDGKVSTTSPQVGYVYSCTNPSSTNGAGSAPWINSNGLTWDSTAKVAVRGAVQWASTFASNVANGLLNITGNGLPVHTTGTFPIGATDPAYQYDKNPNSILSVAITWGLPANPSVAAAPSCTNLGAIGVLLTGSRLFNALDADGRDAVAHEVQDTCNGHPQSAGMYHYHNVSSCVTQTNTAGTHSQLVGYIADGFGLYGNLGEDGVSLTNADLDECHGHSHALTINGQTVTQYHYHATTEYPYTVGCYKGTPVSIH